MPDVSKELLKGAYLAGRKLQDRYYANGLILSTAENNRAMELAFLWGLLGYKFDDAPKE